MNKELQELKARISSLSDEELLKMVYVDFADYREEAISFAKQELKKRSLEDVSEKEIKEILEKSTLDIEERELRLSKLFAKLPTISLAEPNSIEDGGWILMILGAIYLTLGLFLVLFSKLLGTSIAAVGLIFVLLGIMAVKRLSNSIYVGIVLWLLDILSFAAIGAKYGVNLSPIILSLALIIKLWVLWELIKSTPPYLHSLKPGARKKKRKIAPAAHYPNVFQAIILIIFLISLRFVLFLSGEFILKLISFIRPIYYRIMDLWEPEVLNVLSFGIILYWGLKKTNAPFRKVFPFSSFPLFILIPLTLVVLGINIIASQVNNILLSLSVPGIPMFPTRPIILFSISAVLIGPFREELLFRGLILKGFLGHYSVLKTIFLSAIIFALFHLNLHQLFSAFTVGIFLAWLFYRTRSLLPCIFAHSLYNALNWIARSVLGLDIAGYTRKFEFDSVTQSYKVQFQPFWFVFLGLMMLAVGFIILLHILDSHSLLGNINTKILHKSSCGYLPDLKNRTKFAKYSEAFEIGYRQCKYCEPYKPEVEEEKTDRILKQVQEKRWTGIERICPKCGCIIKPDADRCRYCGYEI